MEKGNQTGQSSPKLQRHLKHTYIDYPRWQVSAKKILDLVISGFLLLLVSPLWLSIVIWIRLDSPGHAIFCQQRIGLNGKPYTIYKFRTMVQNAEVLFKEKLDEVKDLDNFVFQDKADSRITKSGRFLRKTSLDELPQLINILIGNMSLVGPRPEIPDIVRHYSAEQRKRLNVLPGVTGLAQVNGRSELTLGETMAYDLEYVNNWSFWLDLWILWKTINVVFTRKGAY
jgi:lipopolysaccharide/colanic/teichoic acid biosynthesis glycosyltransferase